ncbi:MAG TPA: 4-(cytidine 5'-diphospho)-2-C-methyl-D-erythritol kinase [Chitinophagaceae bacterium]
MIVFPNCKINLGLQVLRRRQDGFHDLETVFYPVPLFDVLEIIAPQNSGSPGISFSVSGIALDPGENLCVKACRLFADECPGKVPSSVQMHLHKSIPAGAGLGGGSADAAFTLRLLNTMFEAGLSNDQLMSMAASLGSDCAFFILDKAAIATGRGELLQPHDVDLSAYRIVIVNPGIHISTAAAFSWVNAQPERRSLSSIIKMPVTEWKHHLVNDFEQPVIGHYPLLQQIKDRLYDSGALYASLSGSGSSMFGIFAEPIQDIGRQFPGCFVADVPGALASQLQ